MLANTQSRNSALSGRGILPNGMASPSNRQGRTFKGLTMTPNRATLQAIRAGRTCIMQRGRSGLVVGCWHLLDTVHTTRRVLGIGNDGRRSVYQVDLDCCFNERKLPDSYNPWAGEPAELDILLTTDH